MVLPKTSGFSMVETVAAQMVANCKNMCTPFVGMKGYKKRIQNKETRWREIEGYVDDASLSLNIGEVVDKIEYCVEVQILIELISELKARLIRDIE